MIMTKNTTVANKKIHVQKIKKNLKKYKDNLPLELEVLIIIVQMYVFFSVANKSE